MTHHHTYYLDPKAFYDLQRDMMQRYIALLSDDSFTSQKPYPYHKQSEILMDEIKRIKRWLERSPFYTDGETIGDVIKAERASETCNPIPYFVGGGR